MKCKSLLGVKGLNRREVICWSIVCTRKCFFIDNDSENNLVWRWCLLNNSWCFVTLLQQSYIFKIFHVIKIFLCHVDLLVISLIFSKFNDEHKMRKFLLVWIIVNKGKKIMLDLSKLQPAGGNSFYFLLFLQFFSEVKPSYVPITPLSVQFVPVVSLYLHSLSHLFLKLFQNTRNALQFTRTTWSELERCRTWSKVLPNMGRQCSVI